MPMSSVRLPRGGWLKNPFEDLSFAGSNDKVNPIRFLKRFNGIVEYENIKIDEQLYYFGKCMKGQALTWFEINEFEEIIEAESDFKEKFWGEEAQARFREQLYMGRYANNKGLSMADYAMNMARQAKVLDPPMSEKEIVRCVKRHFDREISREIGPSVVMGIKEMIKLLEEIEDEKRVSNEKRNRSIYNFEQRNIVEDRRSQRDGNRYENNKRMGKLAIQYKAQNNREYNDNKENRIERFDRNRYDNFRRINMNRENRNNFDGNNYRYSNRYNRYENTYRGNRDRNEINYRNSRGNFDSRQNYERRQSKPVIEFPVSDEEERKTYKKLENDNRLEPRDRRFQVQQSSQKSRGGQNFKKVIAIEKQKLNGNRSRGGKESNESDSSIGSGKSVRSNGDGKRQGRRDKSEISIIRTKEIFRDVDEVCEEMQIERENSEPFLVIGKIETRALIDTGAQISAITKSLYDRLVEAKRKMLVVPIKKFALRGAFSDKGSVIAYKVQFEFEINKVRVT